MREWNKRFAEETHIAKLEEKIRSEGMKDTEYPVLVVVHAANVEEHTISKTLKHELQSLTFKSTAMEKIVFIAGGQHRIYAAERLAPKLKAELVALQKAYDEAVQAAITGKHGKLGPKAEKQWKNRLAAANSSYERVQGWTAKVYNYGKSFANHFVGQTL